jgi:hypothetical protein
MMYVDYQRQKRCCIASQCELVVHTGSFLKWKKITLLYVNE